jgi:hypothetical protein
LAKFRLELAESGTIQQNSGKILPESERALPVRRENSRFESGFDE